MKKLILLIFLCSLFSSISSFGQGLHFGLRAGPNFSNFAGSGLDDFDISGITNFHGGVFVELGLFENFSLQPELHYSTKGAKLSGLGQEFENKLGYLSIPVLARFYLSTDKLSFDLGPQFSVLMSQTSNINISDSRTFEFGMVGGLTWHILGPIFIQGRYNWGLSNVKPDASLTNSVIQLAAGIRF